MGTEKRQSGNSIKRIFFNEFYSFSFYKAVKLLEKFFPDKKRIGTTLNPNEEVVRFTAKPSLTFPPSDISDLSYKEKDKPVNMEITFMGLIGPNGVLPQWVTEFAIDKVNQNDKSFTDFLDMFHHRLISLFYLAWKKHHVVVNYEPGGKDRFSGYILSLLGLGTPGLIEAKGKSKKLFEPPVESLIFYSGLLSRQIPSVVSLEAAVEYFCSTSARVDQFIERMLPIPIEDQSQIGKANRQLGINTVCGSFVRERQSKFRINLGPMSYDDFLRFLPNAQMLSLTTSLIRYIVGMEYEFDVRLFVKRNEVPPCTLGETKPKSPRLGWSTWIRTPDFVHEKDPYVTLQVFPL